MSNPNQNGQAKSGFMAQLVRNQLIKAIKNKLNLTQFHYMELEIKNGKVRFNVDDNGWQFREIEAGEFSEMEEQTGITFDSLFVTIKASEIAGEYFDKKGNPTKFQF